MPSTLSEPRLLAASGAAALGGPSAQDRRLPRLRAGLLGLAAALAVLGLSPGVLGQEFPDDPEAWFPLRCRGGVMVDAVRDEPGAIDERDIVGDEDFPAAFRSADDDFLYLRLRLDQDPVQGMELLPFSWAFGFDLDGDRSTYELLVVVDGLAGELRIHENSETTFPDDPTDPPDEPPLAVYPLDTHIRVIATDDDSDFGGDADLFLEMAVPWDDLAEVFLEVVPDRRVSVFAATSGPEGDLDGDFACLNGGGADARLTVVISDGVVIDATLDADLDGFSDEVEIEAGADPDDPSDFPGEPPPVISGEGGLSLEGGGPGCAVAGRGSPSASPSPLWLILATLGLLWRRTTS